MINDNGSDFAANVAPSFPFKNCSDETVPPFALMEVFPESGNVSDSAINGAGEFTIRKPHDQTLSLNPFRYLINGSAPVVPGASSESFLIHRGSPIVYVTRRHGVGAVLGPVPGEWFAGRGRVALFAVLWHDRDETANVTFCRNYFDKTDQGHIPIQKAMPGDAFKIRDVPLGDYKSVFSDEPPEFDGVLTGYMVAGFTSPVYGDAINRDVDVNRADGFGQITLEVDGQTHDVAKFEYTPGPVGFNILKRARSGGDIVLRNTGDIELELSGHLDFYIPQDVDIYDVPTA
ncbi:hypothetical protein [Rosistilla oblonga]|uniref:hypothetical protein n=1 Tax=Rosistilla oblonga TaxID=2527990 RepID=UPI003A97C58A